VVSAQRIIPRRTSIESKSVRHYRHHERGQTSTLKRLEIFTSTLRTVLHSWRQQSGTRRDPVRIETTLSR